MEAAFVLLGFAGPVAGYAWADRRSNGSPLHLISGAAFGGLTVGFLFALASAAQIPAQVTGGGLLPWIIVFAATGAALGILGVVARLVASLFRS